MGTPLRGQGAERKKAGQAGDAAAAGQPSEAAAAAALQGACGGRAECIQQVRLMCGSRPACVVGVAGQVIAAVWTPSVPSKAVKEMLLQVDVCVCVSVMIGA